MLIGERTQDWQVLGGTITTVTLNGVVWQVHKFTVNGDLVIAGPRGILDANDLSDPRLFGRWLMVAGGGGGGGTNTGGWNTGGGGGGGVRRGNGLFKPGTYPWVIGAGGAGGLITPTNGTNGGDTTFNGLTASGGGGGGKIASAGLAGGNGGGGSVTGVGGAGNTPATTPAQGRAGQGWPATGVNTSNGIGGGLGFTPPNDVELRIVGLKNGAVDDISGVAVTYASGGVQVDTAGGANTGDGGGGTSTVATAPAGGSGVGFFAFPISGA